MAGYIFNLDSPEAFKLCANNGIYSTRLTPPEGYWKTHHEGTFADYVTMKAGDNVYFFFKRKIYGIGKLINVGPDCKYFNYPKAGFPKEPSYEDIKTDLLWDNGEISINQRMICLFEPDPYFFDFGIDMDDVLSSNPSAFKMLRVFWKLSFIKFDDKENQAFKDAILKCNESNLLESKHELGFNKDIHQHIESRVSKDYFLSVDNLLDACADDGLLKHEMALETGLLSQLSNGNLETAQIFGEWDYLSHQVVASPFKPVDYMDKMDVFGYSFIKGHKPTISKYLIVELKRGLAELHDLDQLMKYVDWVKNEYCYGDYSMINAFLVAHEFDTAVLEDKHEKGERKYTIGMKPAQSLEWNNLRLVQYKYDNSKKLISFKELE